MTFVTPPDMGTMVDALVERCSIDTNDPRATTAILTDMLNAGWHRFDIANPFGWPWNVVEYETTLAAGNNAFLIGLEGDPALVAYRDVILHDPEGVWRMPLERVTRSEQMWRYPRLSEVGVPATFSILGTGSPFAAIRIAPTPQLTYPVTITGSRLHADLTDPDPDGDFRITEYADAVIEYAAFVFYRSRDNVADAVSALNAFNAEVARLRTNVRIASGPGVTTNPVAIESVLLP